MRIFTFLIVLFLSSSAFSQEWQKYNEQANAAIQKRDFDNAIKFTELATQDLTRIYGDSSKFHINQLGMYGKIYYYLGYYDKAIENYETEKLLILKLRGKNDLYYARAVNNLSVVYSSIGKNDQVEKLLKESIEIKKSCLVLKIVDSIK